MSGWVLWVVAACAFGAGEILTDGLFLVPFVLGAALAALTDAAVGGVASWIVFILASLLGLTVARAVARSHLRTPPQVRTGAAALIGKQAVVLERIVNDQGVGCIKIDGEVWTARAFDDDRVIERGTPVEVVDSKGAAALVTE